MPRGKGPAKGAPNAGRPRIQIDWSKAARLAAIYCPPEDIAGVLDCSLDTLQAACKREHGMTFAAWCAPKRSHCRAAIRGMQMASARQGSIAMQIWLGKNLLKQTDRIIKYDSAWAREQDREEIIRKGQEAIAILAEKVSHDQD